MHRVEAGGSRCGHNVRVSVGASCAGEGRRPLRHILHENASRSGAGRIGVCGMSLLVREVWTLLLRASQHPLAAIPPPRSNSALTDEAGRWLTGWLLFHRTLGEASVHSALSETHS